MTAESRGAMPKVPQWSGREQLVMTARRTLASVRQRWACAVAPATVALIWCMYFERWPLTASFAIPTAYVSGDVLAMLGIAKGFSEFPVPWNLEVAHLNAPFGADWNDYPHTEKLLFYAWGFLLRFLSVGVAANSVHVLAHVGTAFTFAWAASRFGYRNFTVLVGTVILAFSRFMIGRGLGHINVIFVWHLPLLLYLVVRVASIERPPPPRTTVAACLLMVALGLQNPYYPAMILQLLALATVRAWFAGRRSSAKLGAAILAVGVLSFGLGQLNVMLRAHRAGANLTFGGRSLEEMRMWSLRLPDLFLPWQHPVAAWQNFAQAHYFDAGNPPTENAFAFLGLAGCALFFGLALRSFQQGLSGRVDAVTWEAWLILYVLFFSLSGGLGYVVGSLGVTWLRAVNRYSIVMLCVLLFWACRCLDGLRRDSHRTVTLLGALGFTLLELFSLRPGDHAEQTQATLRTLMSDKNFARTLERGLPRSASVFQLPVMGFPEAAPIQLMADYEHLRPYLWTSRLRYSYGTHKGRERESWQTIAEQSSTPALVEHLRERGFQALQINRKGFADRGVKLEAELVALRAQNLATSADGDLVAYRLPRVPGR